MCFLIVNLKKKKKTMKKIIIICGVTFLLLQSCKSSKVEPEEHADIPEITADAPAYVQLLGTEPFWNIAVSEKQIVFANAEGDQIVFPYQPPVKTADTASKTYTVQNNEYTLQATVPEGDCSDGMSDNHYTYKTHVLLTKKGKEILNQNGCAHYILDHDLAGKWLLTEINMQKLPREHEYVTPFIEFDAENNKIVGNASCNGLMGEVLNEGKNIRFTHIGLTRMFCVNETIEAEFTKALEQITAYEITGNTLKLFSGNQVKMVFTR